MKIYETTEKKLYPFMNSMGINPYLLIIFPIMESDIKNVKRKTIHVEIIINPVMFKLFVFLLLIGRLFQ